MIDEDKLKRLTTGTLAGPGFCLKTLSEQELLSLRAEIDRLLPERSLADMNLESELIYQYEAVKQLQRDVAGDFNVPANQRAQVANAVVGTLDALVKMQERYHTAERFKAIENLLIKHLRTLPVEVAEQFIADYEALGA